MLLLHIGTPGQASAAASAAAAAGRASSAAAAASAAGETQLISLLTSMDPRNDHSLGM